MQIKHESLTAIHCGVTKILTVRFSKSILLPRTTKGNLSGPDGDACTVKSSLHLSKDLKDFSDVTSNTSTQQSAPRKNADPKDANRSCPAVSHI